MIEYEGFLTLRKIGVVVVYASSVLIVDDHELFRRGLIAAMDNASDHRIEWLEAASLQQAMSVLRDRDGVSLVILDLKLPDTTGFGALTSLRQAFPDQRILVISASTDDVIHAQVVALGAWGFVGKTAASETLRGLFHTALTSRARRAAGDIEPLHVRAARRQPVGYAHLQRLGDRHMQILELLLQGRSNQDIVRETGLALGTVKNYVSAVLLCFEARSRAHLLSLFS
ncbi:MAG TPA: response regulator transcription factor [Vineibacter sp.]|nr:response regulator transcription factor [Vineibacter sp.]